MMIEKVRSKNMEQVFDGLIFHLPVSLRLQNQSIMTTISHTEMIREENRPTSSLQIPRQEIVPKETIIPFTDLKVSNAPEVYKIAKSYISDISKGQFQFGIIGIGGAEALSSLVTIAACLSYSQNNSSVAIVVDDSSSEFLKRFHKDFTKGTLGNWQTYDWGNLAIVDYKEIARHSRKGQVDFSALKGEFDAVFWMMPDEKRLGIIKDTYLDILKHIDSITFIVKAGELKMKDLKKMEEHYRSLGIPLKGMLYQGGEK